MGRKNKTAIASTCTPGPSEAAGRELRAELDHLLRLVNEKRADPLLREAFLSIAEMRRPRWSREVLRICYDETLGAIFVSGPIANLRSKVRAGVVFPRVCPH
jgi:hypothetical protein